MKIFLYVHLIYCLNGKRYFINRKFLKVLLNNTFVFPQYFIDHPMKGMLQN